MQDPPQPLRVTGQHRFVETVVGLQLRQLFFIECAAAARVAAAAHIALLQRCLRHHAFDGPAGHDAGDGEHQQRDADECRYHQQQASEEVTGHSRGF